jgi:glycosyltransferase involved in cell wall biosynthesis
MRILMLHNRYKLKGGEDESTRSECAMLQASGHDVKLLEFNNDSIPSAGDFQTGVNAIWSGDAYRLVQSILSRERFDILHVQNFFPLWSPSVYYAASNNGTAVVQSVRNFRLVCPAGSLFRDGHHCDLCVGKKIPWPGVLHGCYRSNRLASGAVAAMIATHWALGTWDRLIHQYVALTSYVREQLIAGHFPENRISIKPNFVVDPQLSKTCQKLGDYFIFVGRLSKEKGLEILLNAWRLRKADVRLRLVGGGVIPESLSVPEGVEILGERPLTETYRLIAGAKALILPAMAAETFGRVVIEAFALGTPVISTSAGGLAELVTDNVTGLLVDAGNSEGLAAAIDRMSADAGLCARLSKDARQTYVASFTEKVNYEKLIAIYKRAIEISAAT